MIAALFFVFVVLPLALLVIAFLVDIWAKL